MKSSRVIAIILATTTLAACTEPNGAPGRGIENGGALSKEDIGAAVGVVGGALIGSTIGGGIGEVAAIIGGGILGGAVGDAAGRSLDNADRAAYGRASQRAMESGRSSTWKNSDNGHYGTVTPYKRYRNDEGQECREYTQKIYVDGEKRQGHGTACRQTDGTWQITE